MRILTTVACVFALAVSTALGMRVYTMERSELSLEGDFRSVEALAREAGATAISVRLASMRLNKGEVATFEVCSKGELDPSRGVASRPQVHFVVWSPTKLKVLLRVKLDDAHLAVAKRSPELTCLTLGGGTIDADDTYALDLVWPEGPLPPSYRAKKFQGRVLARRPLTGADTTLVFVLGALALLVSWSIGQGVAPLSQRASPGQGLWLLPLGVGLLFGVTLAVAWVPYSGAFAGLIKGIALAAAEIAIALGVARAASPRDVRGMLGLHSPVWPRTTNVVAVAGSACLLVLSAKAALRVIPSTGEAPIQSFVSWPSGMLSFAALAMIVPVAEELYFRGFVYSVARPFGRLPAFVAASGLFVVAHVHQTWGGWGGLVSVAIASLVLTTLRVISGSTATAMLAHLAYNVALSASAILRN